MNLPTSKRLVIGCLICLGAVIIWWQKVLVYEKEGVNWSPGVVSGGDEANSAITAEKVETGQKVRVKLRLKQNAKILENLVYNNGSKQVIDEQGFYVQVEHETPILAGSVVLVTGTAQARMSGILQRQIVLEQPEILVIENGEITGGLVEEKLMPWIWGMQEEFSRRLERNLPEPHGSLLVGILLGLKRSMPREFYDALVDTGTLHVIAASGFNITIVARVFLWGFNRLFSRRTAIAVSMVGIVWYVLLAGASPAVVRAGLMGGLAFTAQFLGREYLASWSLVLSALGMVAVEPEMLGDVGFWLSVTATGGILWLSAPIDWVISRVGGNLLNRWRRLVGWRLNADISENILPVADSIYVLRVDLVTTLAAQLGTLPVLLGVFGRVSVVSPIVNVLVVWLVPVIMAVGAMKLVFGFVWEPLGLVLGYLVWIPLEVFVGLVESAGNVRGISYELEGLKFEQGGLVVWFGVICYYLILFWWWKYGAYRQKT